MPMPDGTDEVDWRGWNAHAVYFQDAAGNIGELIARHNLPGRDAPFGVQGWQRISEIGLAVDDVAQAAHSLDMPVFEPGDGENFTALGDDLGLLIIVKQGRAWFPTADCYAQPDPVDVVVNSPVQSTMTVPGGPYRITYTQREMI